MSKMSEFEAIKALFTKWNESGVPKGIAYPKTQSDAVGWSCREFGIEGIGSRREFRSTHEEYGTIVLEIRDLIAGLKPESEVDRRKKTQHVPAETAAPAKKRINKTQKARRRAAEVKREEYRVMLVAELEKHHAVREELGSAKRDLIIEKQHSEHLQTEIAALKAENASLKQKLVGKGGVLQLVD
ncbi:hypothetical protein [Rhizobium leguminosarum]|uniref:hypothetical protein n=1 Tax=Rhizobium leguminosarum TaxID=384 RepID=UPI0015F9C054|nr:hypothetical protein [Rhizobium leguminosarum]MBA8835161.1 hypothetical protein [Rhizobium leguminosarum]